MEIGEVDLGEINKYGKITFFLLGFGSHCSKEIILISNSILGRMMFVAALFLIAGN